jgi:MFS family permease
MVRAMPDPADGRAAGNGAARSPLTFGWRQWPVMATALVALGAGFGQFGAVSALGDVAKTFGHLTHGASFADEVGLSGTLLGVGLAVLRLASLGGLPLAGLADRFGRRRMLLATCGLGLVCTVVASASPSYWWFVVIFAAGRPLLSATSGVAQVAAVELTSSVDRARAVALVAAGYGVGAGLTAVIHSLGEGALGFRGVFALAAVPLMALPLLRWRLVEPDRYALLAAAEHGQPVLGPVARGLRGRLLVVGALAFAVSVVTGPANSLVFIYAQNLLHVSGIVTSAMVVAAGAVGLAGLLLGRWLADNLGRRPTVAISIVGMAVFGTLAYTGSTPALLVGYVMGVAAGSVFAPAGGALANELFPTAVRASVAGWYIAAGVLGAVAGLLEFGALADVSSIGNHAGFAAAVTFLPMIPAALLLFALPETRGHELDASLRSAASLGSDEARVRSRRSPGDDGNPP